MLLVAGLALAEKRGREQGLRVLGIELTEERKHQLASMETDELTELLARLPPLLRGVDIDKDVPPT